MEKQMEKTNKDVPLRELSERVAEFARVRGWDMYHSPRNLLLALVSHSKPTLFGIVIGY